MKINIIVKDGIAIPVVKAKKSGKIGYILCPYCDQKHTHGNTKDFSHRVAHCFPKEDKHKMYIVNESKSYEIFIKNGYYVDFT